MARLLILALDRDSRTATRIAANIVRRLPRGQVTCAFVTAPDATTLVHDLGFSALALDHGSAVGNRDSFDRMVAAFDPDQILVADEPALTRSTSWSGLDLASVRQRHQVPLVCLDRYGRGSVPAIVDEYGGEQCQHPALSDRCDLVLRAAPPFRAAGDAGVVPISLSGGGLRACARLADPPRRIPGSDAPTVFISDPAAAVAPRPAHALAVAMPRIIHDHLAAMDRGLNVVHIGGPAWDFARSDRITYRHYAKMPPAMYREQLLAADLYLSTNVAASSLVEAALSGVPALVLRQDDDVVVRGPDANGPGWLADVAPNVDRVHPFLAFPWGWHQLFTEALRDNPFAGCFHSARLTDRLSVVAAATALLDDSSTRSALYQRQLDHRTTLDALPTVAEIFAEAVAR